jgi:hypothetical protein
MNCAGHQWSGTAPADFRIAQRAVAFRSAAGRDRGLQKRVEIAARLTRDPQRQRHILGPVAAVLDDTRGASSRFASRIQSATRAGTRAKTVRPDESTRTPLCDPGRTPSATVTSSPSVNRISGTSIPAPLSVRRRFG